ncbi:hypothetical protein [Proteiniphilum sp. UBA5384]|jgi:hypothetical protein|uniref:hypothetical protein n=1 Tax=Proteiniphilum sp. UBA5384 TaxID=1947279 RepID=UPI0025D581B7|nr:hypothetical protein [Proteiniphilum sp. UBA5384]
MNRQLFFQDSTDPLPRKNEQPELALDPEISAQILVEGMILGKSYSCCTQGGYLPANKQ